MNKNIEMLLEASREKGVPYEINHPSGNLVTLLIGGARFPFVNWSTPLNPQSVVQMCQDKDYFHSFYSDTIRMPTTEAFLTPYCDKKYAEYLSSKTIFEIIEHAESAYGYPVIVKKNRGSWGTNVFKVNNRKELEGALIAIFNVNSAAFDYVGLVQEYVEIKSEYRAIFLNGSLVFCYKKVFEDATYVGNLSPLHWEGSYAEIENDSNIIHEIKEFCTPLFERMLIPFCGLDIAINGNDEYFLIEANSSPGFDHILRAGDHGMVKKLYMQVVEYLITEQSSRALSY